MKQQEQEQTVKHRSVTVGVRDDVRSISLSPVPAARRAPTRLIDHPAQDATASASAFLQRGEKVRGDTGAAEMQHWYAPEEGQGSSAVDFWITSMYDTVDDVYSTRKCDADNAELLVWQEGSQSTDGQLGRQEHDRKSIDRVHGGAVPLVQNKSGLESDMTGSWGAQGPLSAADGSNAGGYQLAGQVQESMKYGSCASVQSALSQDYSTDASDALQSKELVSLSPFLRAESKARRRGGSAGRAVGLLPEKIGPGRADEATAELSADPPLLQADEMQGASITPMRDMTYSAETDGSASPGEAMQQPSVTATPHPPAHHSLWHGVEATHVSVLASPQGGKWTPMGGQGSGVLCLRVEENNAVASSSPRVGLSVPPSVGPSVPLPHRPRVVQEGDDLAGPYACCNDSCGCDFQGDYFAVALHERTCKRKGDMAQAPYIGNLRQLRAPGDVGVRLTNQYVSQIPVADVHVAPQVKPADSPLSSCSLAERACGSEERGGSGSERPAVGVGEEKDTLAEIRKSMKLIEASLEDASTSSLPRSTPRGVFGVQI